MRYFVRSVRNGLFLSLIMSAPAHAGWFFKGPPNAEQLSFLNCDGYQMPSKRADGLTTGTWLFGLAAATTDQRRENTALGPAGIVACDSALANPELPSAFVMRRAHLLQSKAMHQIASGKPENALETLLQSDAAGRSEPLFDQSLGEGNRALRAIAFHALGRKTDAEAALSEMERMRPFSASMQILAGSVRLQFEDDRDKQATILERQAPINPGAWHRLFWMAMMYDDYRAALHYAPAVRFDLPRNRGAWVVEGSDVLRYTLIKDRADFAGAVAYAHMAVGEKEQAAATIKDINSAIVDWIKPPPPPEEGREWSRSQKADWEKRKQTGTLANNELKRWVSAIALRADAKGKSLEEILKLFDERKPPLLAITSVVAEAAAPQPADGVQIRSLLETMTQSKDATRLKQMKIDFQQLVTLLPRPETAAMRPIMQSEGGNLLRSDLNGYGIRANDEPGSLTVRFGTATGSVAMADEAALLAAATHAVKQGKDALLIDTRQTLQRTTKMVGMYSGGAEIPSGYEVRLSLRPVLAASVPTAEQAKLLRADQLIAALASKYPRPGKN